MLFFLTVCVLYVCYSGEDQGKCEFKGDFATTVKLFEEVSELRTHSCAHPRMQLMTCAVHSAVREDGWPEQANQTRCSQEKGTFAHIHFNNYSLASWTTVCCEWTPLERARLICHGDVPRLPASPGARIRLPALSVRARLSGKLGDYAASRWNQTSSGKSLESSFLFSPESCLLNNHNTSEMCSDGY